MKNNQTSFLEIMKMREREQKKLRKEDLRLSQTYQTFAEEYQSNFSTHTKNYTKIEFLLVIHVGIYE